MAIRHFQGYDIQNLIATGLNSGGDDDAFPDWFGSTLQRPSYIQGYLEGQAIYTPHSIPLSGRGVVTGGVGSAVFGFWGRGVLNVLGGISNLVKLYQSNKYYYVRATGSGSLQIFEANGVLAVGNPISPELPGSFGEDWNHYEFSVDMGTGQVSLTINNVTVLAGQGTPVTPEGNVRVYIGGHPQHSILGRAWNHVYDHQYMADGPLTQDQIQSVSVVSSQDRFEGLNGFRGTVIIAGNRYVTDWRSALISSLNTYGGVFGVNVCNTVSYFFHTDPSDNEAWTPEKYESIQSWGVCFQEQSPAQLGNRARLDALCLSRLVYNNGMPLVLYEIPGATTQFSGPWEKVNSEKTYAAHVNQVPRPYVFERDNAESLYIGNPGCLLFTRQNSEDPNQPIGIVGLTFAEKNQVNHRDWTSVDGIGEAADASFVSGYGVYGESDKKFQSNYVTVNYETTPTGSAYIQGVWDYSIDPDTGKWSMRQQVYGPKSSTEYKHAQRKLKIRGHGKALQLRVSSFGDAPFIINGWAVFVTSNTVA